MKSNYLKIKLMMVPVIMFFCSFVQNDGLRAENIKMDQKNEVKKTPYVEYHNRMTCFSPFHQCYERIKNDAFYAGVEGWLIPAYSEKRTHTILDAEFRMGYNFFCNGTNHVTPLVGVGMFEDFKVNHHNYHYTDKNGEIISAHYKHKKMALVYAAVGFLYDHEFNSIFNLGLNSKGLFGAAVIDNSPDKNDWGKFIAGVDVAMPITFRFGKNRHWDFRIEPFDIFIHGQENSMNYIGLRNTLGYRF
jgi:hypothetical protein